MSFGGGSYKVPESDTPILTDTTAADEASDKERRAALLRRGRASTILTDGQTLGVAATKKATLLGG